MNLIIDEGNTRIKLAIFNKMELLDIEFTNRENCREDISKVCQKYKIDGCIVSSVTDEIISEFEKLLIKKKVKLTNMTSLPFIIDYKTPKTLGVDRIALVAAAWQKYPKESSLVIDAGTCITYDFIDSNGVFYGGAISPGIEMRLKGLHTFTKKLPYISVEDQEIGLIGQTTEESIKSGVVNGTVFEITGVIETYQQKFGKVNIILTGGDAYFLDKRLKNSIFVNQNFLLEGLNQILTYQIKDEAKFK
ncbi:type III pantothenate kinase [Wenyingzhuangia sp. IMCC45574]